MPAGTTVLGVETLPWLAELPTSAIGRTATGAMFRVVVPSPPSLSTTVRVTVRAPAAPNVWFVVGPAVVSVSPSPKSHS